jgi:predicted MFS family arabinose efflux permease
MPSAARAHKEPSDFAAQSESSLRYAGWRVALAAAGCVFVSFASLLVFTFSVFLKPLTLEFGWSRESASLAFGIAAMTVAACSPPLGLLLDRFPARRIALPCITIFGCAFASLSFMTGHLWHFYAIFFVLGIVGNGTAQLAYSRAVATWFREKRGAAFAVLMTGSALGAMIWPPIAQAFIAAFAWRHTTVILGAIVLSVGWPLAMRVKERQDAVVKDESGGSGMAVSGSTAGEGLRSRIFWIVAAALFCGSISQNGAITHISALLTDRGVSPGDAALAASAIGGAALLGRWVTGWLLDRFFAPRVASALLLIAALGALILAIAHSTAMGVLGASLIGIGMGGEADVTPWLLAKYFGLRAFATLYALTWTVYAIAGAIGPVIMGKAFDATGSYEGLLVELAALTAASAGLMFLMPRYATSPKAALSQNESTASDQVD